MIIEYDDQLRVEALKLATGYVGRRPDLHPSEVMLYAEQFFKFMKGEVHE